jgi:hypothetical protein
MILNKSQEYTAGKYSINNSVSTSNNDIKECELDLNLHTLEIKNVTTLESFKFESIPEDDYTFHWNLEKQSDINSNIIKNLFTFNMKNFFIIVNEYLTSIIHFFTIFNHLQRIIFLWFDYIHPKYNCHITRIHFIHT